MRPASRPLLDPLNPPVPPKVRIEARALFGIPGIKRRLLERVRQQQPGLGRTEGRDLDGLGADEVRRPLGIGEFGDVMRAGKGPDQAAVVLDGFSQRRKQVQRKDAFADLLIDILELIQRHRQPALVDSS